MRRKVEDQFNIDTPEAVGVGYDVAGIGSRFLAQVIDVVIIASGETLIAIGALALASIGANTLATILALTLSFVLIFGYFVLYEAFWSGQTPGKRGMNIRVLRTSGYPIGFMDSFIRNLVRWVDLLPMFYGVGIVVMFISSQSRRLGDYAAGTLVVREGTRISMAEIDVIAGHSAARPDHVAPAGAVDPDELQWNLDALMAGDLLLMRVYLDRVPSLESAARDRLGHEVAARIAARIGAREPFNPVAFLQRVLALKTSM